MKISIWEEKYRPHSLANMILPDNIKTSMQTYIENGEIPNMIFSGPAGVGKTTLARIITQNIDCEFKVLNGSDANDRGISAISNTIGKFASVGSFKKWKVVFIDEGEQLTPDAWKALKGTVEKYNKKVRFIFTTNFLYQVPSEVLSRLAKFDFPKLGKSVLLDYYKRVLENEEVKFTQMDIETVYKLNNGDLRSSLIYLQQNSLTGTLKINSTDFVEVVGLIKKRDIRGLKEYFAVNSVNWLALYRYIFDMTDDPKKLLILGKYFISHSQTLDPEINFLTFVCELP